MINAKRKSALIGEQRPFPRVAPRARNCVPRHANIYRDISSERLAIAPVPVPRRREADKEARRKMGGKRGNSIAKSYANSTDTRPRSAARGSRYSPAIFYRGNIASDRPTAQRVQPPGANVAGRVGAVHHGDILKDIPDDRLSGRANNGGDTRALAARGWRGEGERRERKIPQPVIRVECIIKIPRG